ncbi:MAG: hypothetical protein AAF497_11115 [Planctomycetota bacterium]
MRSTTTPQALARYCGRRIRRFRDSDDGASAFECAVMLAGVAIATTMLANTLGLQMASTFSKTEEAFNKAMTQREVTTVSNQ